MIRIAPIDSTLNVYNGSGANSPAFISPGYAGYGSAVSLNGNNQYVSVPGPYMNFSYRSFTVEAWIYPFVLSSSQDYVILSQCTAASRRLCLILMFRQAALCMAFWDDDCQSSTVVTSNRWHHVAYVYEYSTFSKKVYLNGELVCINTTSSPYEGSSGTIYMGVGYIGSFWAWWNGYLDQLSIVFRAKSASEVSDDATLVVHYSFDNPTHLEQDSGPLNIAGLVGNNLSNSASGPTNGCLFFPGVSSDSFFQMAGLRRLGIPSESFSMSLWLNPSIVTNGTIVHLSSNRDGTGGKHDLYVLRIFPS